MEKRNTWSSSLTSEIFQISGPEGKVFRAHSEIIARWSKVMACDVVSGMVESRDKHIRIQDIDGDIDDDTVMRFLEYAYTGDYTVPDPDIIIVEKDGSSADVETTGLEENLDVEAEAEVQEPTPEQELSAEYYVLHELRDVSVKKKSKKGVGVARVSKRSRLWEAFKSKVRYVEKARWQPREPSTDGPDEDFSQVLLCHAKLYVFSHRYQSEELGTLALQKLRLTLCCFSPLQERQVGDVVGLAKYAYEHTADREGGEPDEAGESSDFISLSEEAEGDLLRSMVVEYMACHMESRMHNKELRDLLRGGGALSEDLAMRMLEQLD